jgi:streptogramin lyase
MLAPGGAKPEGIMVMKDGKAVILERDDAIIALKEGTATLN